MARRPAARRALYRSYPLARKRRERFRCGRTRRRRSTRASHV